MGFRLPTFRCSFSRCLQAARAVAVLALVGLLAPASHAQFAGDPTQRADLEGVGLTRLEGDQVPLGLTFRDTDNNLRTLGELFEEDGPPVILLPVYFDCPVICPMTLNQAGNALRFIKEWTPGDDYRLLVLSFDHRDSPRSARVQRDAFLLKFDELPLEDGIEFWTGDTENILALMDAVGFGYRFVPASGHFTHTSSMIFLRNDGTIHNYLPGSEYSAQQVRTGVTEAAEGQSQTLWDQVVLLCRVRSETTGEYVISPMRVMQLVGALTVVVLATGIAVLVVTNKLRDTPSL
ncbi:MAG: SCO family protein [Phycisphaerales bacterium]